MLDSFEQALNWVSDRDVEWWPFVFMRPQVNERMTSSLVATLAVLYGGMIGAMANLAMALLGHRVGLLLIPVGLMLGFFAVFRLSFAWAWNRRAARLVTVTARARW